MSCALVASTAHAADPPPAANATAAVKAPGSAVAEAMEFQRARIAELTQQLVTDRQQQEQAQAALSAANGTEAELKPLRDNLEKANIALREDGEKRDAAETTLAVLGGAQVRPEVAAKALAIEQAELRRVEERVAIAKQSPGTDLNGAEPPEAAAVRHLQTSVDALSKAAQAALPAKVPAPEKTLDQIEFERGDRLKYGPTISLLRFSVARDHTEPGRFRNYEPRLEFVPAEFGFQFVYQPFNRPWRIKRKGSDSFQLLSVGGMLLASIDKNDVSRGSLSLAATLSFFQEMVGLGIGVDLYRGIETAGPGGAVGGDTAYTGLLAWSLSGRGEVTPENIFFVVTLGLVPLVNSITGELQ